MYSMFKNNKLLLLYNFNMQQKYFLYSHALIWKMGWIR